MSSWNLKDNLMIDNNKFLRFLDSTGITKNNILGLNINSHLLINSSNIGDIFLNSNTTFSNTFINTNNSFGNTYIASRLAVGISNTSNITSNITLPINGVIGLNSTQGSHTGYLALSGSSSLLNTTGSRILLYGIDNTSGNSGQVKIYAGNSATGNVNIYTENDSLKFQVLNSGVTNFQPDGTTIRLSISNSTTTITNKVVISSTEISTSSNSGALQIAGGVGISGDTYINGSLNINSLSGNLNFTSSRESTSYTSGATYIVGGLGIQCSVDSYSQTAGGALSVAGGFALGKSANIGGNITVYNSSASTSALSGSGIFYGGIGVSGQVNIRSNVPQQLRIIPTTNGNETSIFFGNQNNYTTTGSWIIGQNVNNIGSASFALYNADSGNYMTFQNNSVNFQKSTYFQNTISFNNTSIANLITIQNVNGNVNWSLGKIINGNDDFHISRFTAGNFINYLFRADTNTGNITIFGTENSNSNISGGSLTVMGGASVAKDLRIGGDIRFSGNLISTSSNDANLFTRLTLTATNDSFSITSGTFVTAGGAGIGKNVNIGGSIVINNVSATSSGTFNAANGTITNGNITGLVFDPTIYRSFSLIMSVSISRTTGGNFMAQYTIEGIQRDNGWNIFVTNLGDTIDLIFNIDASLGQLQYSSTTLYTNWISTVFNYQATVLYISRGFSNFSLPSSSQTLVLANTTNSTDTSTGALIISGGVAIQKNLIVGGNIYGLPQYTVFEEQQPNGTTPTSYTTGNFITRTLNTVVVNTISGCTLNSNQFTLPVGTYRVNIFCPNYAGGSSKAILYNVSNSSNTLLGTSSYGNSNTVSHSIINGMFTITTTTIFAIQQYWQNTNAQMGGIPSNSGLTESYTHSEIIKLL